jgi:hypothetical protein
MDEWNFLLQQLVEWRPAVLLDPMGTFPILADRLEESCGLLGKEAADSLRYWCRVRDGHSQREQAWEAWMDRIMLKYGEPMQTHIGQDGEVFCRLRGRILNYWTHAEFLHSVSPEIVQNQPIVTLEIKRAGWGATSRLSNECWRNVQDLILDFSGGYIRTTGVVYAIENISMPSLRRIAVTVDGQNHGVKGQASVALTDRVRKGEVPRGVGFWWNGEQT